MSAHPAQGAGQAGALRVSVIPVGQAVYVESADGVMPMTVSIGTQTQHKHTRTFAFMSVDSGTHQVVMTDANGRSFETKVAIP